jgi:calcium-binding protein CML
LQGKISDVDIQRIAKELGENFTLQEIQEMVQEADQNGKPFFSLFAESSNRTSYI